MKEAGAATTHAESSTCGGGAGAYIRIQDSAAAYRPNVGGIALWRDFTKLPRSRRALFTGKRNGGVGRGRVGQANCRD
jgi:hypothetical protein